jgi:DNA ligase D-like protein (predicted ligase)
MKIAAMNAHRGDESDLTNPEFIFEPKLDGFRALCYVNNDIRLISRNDLDLTEKYPELSTIRNAINAKSAILDGEIVAFDAKGRSSFQELQQGKKAVYMVFDILMKNGKSLVSLPLLERKKILKTMIKNGLRIKKVKFSNDGKKLWQEACKKNLEGVMAKKFDAHYYPGLRSFVWLKIKRFQTADCVIIGYTQEKRLISSLALGLYDKKGVLEYVGNVGTGFDEAAQKKLYTLLKSIRSAKKPVAAKPRKLVKWVKPKYICEVKFSEVTHDRNLRQPVYIRLRTDKKPKQCTIADQL